MNVDKYLGGATEPVLRILGEEKSVRKMEIEEALEDAGYAGTNAHRIVNELESEGLVDQVKHSHKNTTVALTQDGEDLYENNEEEFDPIVQDFDSSISSETYLGALEGMTELMADNDYDRAIRVRDHLLDEESREYETATEIINETLNKLESEAENYRDQI